MSRVITFSTKFPSHHPRKGEPTYFVEKIQESIVLLGKLEITDEQLKIGKAITKDIVWAKGHTIRAGARWNKGDKFSPRIWSGKPYASKQIAIAPDIEIKEIWSIIIDDLGFIYIDGNLPELKDYDSYLTKLAKNDGLEPQDFIDWFTTSPSFKKDKSFLGQILCWDESIEYEIPTLQSL